MPSQAGGEVPGAPVGDAVGVGVGVGVGEVVLGAAVLGVVVPLDAGGGVVVGAVGCAVCWPPHPPATKASAPAAIPAAHLTSPL